MFVSIVAVSAFTNASLSTRLDAYTSKLAAVLVCRFAGHRYRFRTEGATMLWSCARCGMAGGEKRYPSASEAKRYAASFNREDRDDLGRRAPLIGLFPLRLWRVWRDRRGER